MNKRVAIVKNGVDIGRIISNGENNKSCDFKLNFSDNAYELRLIQLFQKPIILTLEDSINWEISYHKAKSIEPPCVHLKHKSKDQPSKYPKVSKIYETLPLKNLQEPTYLTDFPIPLFKVFVPNGFCASMYKPKPKEHMVLDLGDANAFEAYLTHSSFDMEKFSEKWRAISLGLQTRSIEFLATNDLSYTMQSMKHFLPENDCIRESAVYFSISKNVRLYFNKVKLDSHLPCSDRLQITFIENKFAIPLLGLASVAHSDLKPMCAYLYDLEQNKNSFTERETVEWKYRFEKWRKQLDSEIKKGLSFDGRKI